MYSYGYGELEDKLITLFRSGAPDFDSADELLKLGADLNASGNEDDENILSEILSSYWWSETGGEIYEEGSDKVNKNPNCGAAMVDVIRYFLKNGFDVNKNDGRYGAQCLYALALSVFDAHIIEATKVLLDAGARNIPVSPNENDTEIPWNCIGMEGFYQDTCHNHHLGNIYEAVYQIYQAIEGGRPYRNIDSYEVARGKKISRILAEKPQNGPVFFDLALPESRHQNCFIQKLFLEFDSGVLITTQYADFWVDGTTPDIDLTDVSDRFPGIVGAVVQDFRFCHNEICKGTAHYGQPVTTLVMDNGHKLSFTINFGEAAAENRVAYFTIT